MIFELENKEQVTLTLNYNEDLERWELELRAEFKTASVKVTAGYANAILARLDFTAFTQEFAETFRREMSLKIE